ncbi:MAG: hypothetical protein AAF959_08350 [Cyanobacteria bacterium P01_D01_bin.56]
MSPALFVTLPFVLLLVLSKGLSTNADNQKSRQSSIESVIDLLDGQSSEIIIIRKQKR